MHPPSRALPLAKCNPLNVTVALLMYSIPPESAENDLSEVNVAPVVLVMLTVTPETVICSVKVMSPVTVMSALSTWQRADNAENDEA